ncbi:MauE/DoxX family redox-associated membrane protein [Desulfofundulus salinus]|uniref:DoxX family membrane protein n=1 Tax=Desulfofundulus salinus TaxID=2419843 RepID=A0A494WS82_9FIRM|nr:MauE/DoxX family redox-associated membrane protein [Desulfofundulus salinum]RKO65583.1 DoxX family membrane protein [Desulfofundulus salinum]
MKILHNDYFQLAVRLIMGGLFLYAGLGKIFAPLDFAASVYNYKLLPDELIGPVAVAIPWIETLAGVCLLLGLNTKGGALVISGLLTMFITILIVSAARGLDVECGCFSGVERTVGFLAIFEDMVMLAGALFVLYFDRVKLTPYTFLTRRNKS